MGYEIINFSGFLVDICDSVWMKSVFIGNDLSFVVVNGSMPVNVELSFDSFFICFD